MARENETGKKDAARVQRKQRQALPLVPGLHSGVLSLACKAANDVVLGRLLRCHGTYELRF